MKKALLALLLIPALFLQAQAGELPTAQQVIDKYIEAIGGKDFLASITDITVEMAGEIQGNSMLLTRKQKSPDKFTQTVIAGGMEVMKMTSDGTRLSVGGMGRNQTLDGTDARAGILQGMMFPELHFARLGVVSKLDGTEKINDKEAYKVNHYLEEETVAWTDYYDIDTGLKVQTRTIQKTPQGQMEQIAVYKNYKDFKGLKYPSLISQGIGQFAMEFTVEKVKVNSGIKDTAFVIK